MVNFVLLNDEIEQILEKHRLAKEQFRLFAFDGNGQIITMGTLPWKNTRYKLKTWIREEVD